MATNEILAKELVLLAKDSLVHEDKLKELKNIIEYILLSEDIILDDVLELTPNHTESYDVLDFLHNVSESVASNREIKNSDENYYTSLFVIPVVFSTNSKVKIDSLNQFQDELNLIASALQETHAFSQKNSIYIHNFLYTPEQLLNVEYNTVHGIMLNLCNHALNKPTKIFNVKNNVELEDNTLYIRYLLGIRVYQEKDTPFSEEEELQILTEFNEKASPILSKILSSKEPSIISIDGFYPGMRSGLEFYTSLLRKIELERAVVNANISSKDCIALININVENIEQSTIELKSSLNNQLIISSDLRSLPFQNPKELIDNITYELEEMGVTLENIYIVNDNKVYPVSFFLENEDEIEIGSNVVNFLDNPSV